MTHKKSYSELRAELLSRYPTGATRGGVGIDDIVQLRLQTPYETHLDVARAMATAMRRDMAEYDTDVGKFTQSLGCWSGFHAQQMIKAVKRLRGTTKGAYVYLSGWMVAGLRNRWGHLPDQSMHEKTSVVDLIEEIYVSLRQADEVALNDLFNELKAARAKGAPAKVVNEIIARIDGFESHVVPIIADIDAGFGNEHATYLLAKEMIKAGACCLQIENQVSDAKQCGHQDGKVTVPREDFIEKLRACRLAFEELGVNDGVIVARTDSLGASLTQKIPVSQRPGDMASSYTKWLKTEPVTGDNPLREGEMAIWQNGALVRPARMPNGLFSFREGSGRARVIEDCVASLRDGDADMIWIETDTPNVDAEPSQAGPRAVDRRRQDFRKGLSERQRAHVGGLRRQRPRPRSRRAPAPLPDRHLRPRRRVPQPDHAANLPSDGEEHRRAVARLLRRRQDAGLRGDRAARRNSSRYQRGSPSA
jgi:isocitrate lyase